MKLWASIFISYSLWKMMKMICNNIFMLYTWPIMWSFNKQWKSGGLVKKIRKTSWWLQNVCYFKCSIINCSYSFSDNVSMLQDILSSHLRSFSSILTFVWSFKQTGARAYFSSGYLHSTSGNRMFLFHVSPFSVAF